jgi:HK97 gp10 family phage protein
MASGVKGVSSTIAELRKFGKDVDRVINRETESAANAIMLDAKRLAPANFGKLRQSISIFQPIDARGKNITSYGVYVNELYGAYMEFGTGTKIKIPAEFAEMAATFKGGKKGTWKQGLEAIKVWCRAKGIPEEAAYPIFAKILGAGINPQPFLYPAYQKGKKDYLKNLTKVLKQMNKKI